MPSYKAPLDDIRFILEDVLDVGALAELPGYEDATPDVVAAILEEGARFAERELYPLNRVGDEEGCTYEDGTVRTPAGFKDAYKAFAEGGWTALSSDPAHGGQGLPKSVNFVMEEILSSANMAFAMYPGLTHGAINALETFGSDDQKRTYLPPMISGRWAGTMCLTEPQCGTDLGLVRTKATADPGLDGAYRLTGTKIFISAGEHDLTENIVHLVLARLPDAPSGTRGISLFVVPKFLPEGQGDDATPGARNGVRCASIEHKMGINGSATCVLNFDGAQGWLVGEPHRGLKAMFVMMNVARLGVGLQGLGIAEVAYQNALAYAKDRRQGRALDGPKSPDQPADSLMVHPDVRRMLLTMKAFNEGARMIAYEVGQAIDVADRHPDAERRREAEAFVSLMTPIIKAYFTDMGFDCANMGVQIFGGHGYIREWGMEQHVRDARIAQIYEGANGVQAMDLVGRKLPQETGRLLRYFFHPTEALLRSHAEDGQLAGLVGPLAKAFGKLQQATLIVAQRGLKDPNEAGAAASDYLRLFALVAMGRAWLRMAVVAHEKLAAGTDNPGFHEAKLATARFFMERMLPEANGRFIAIMNGGGSIMGLADDDF
ncbi:acyl-CoA dehydrogenase C-terminal domain-containing protein [Fodinicurvata sp. EGI_FJ10296]|uniref:acyl-CoA dehydrogenase C-terminal domain-containing protein n=1 Tax=Fodinicurvata sp. EGI_FJ10296 TaxID=3231908 RepID=UPI0034519BE0